MVSGASPLCTGATTFYTSSGTAGGTWSSSNTIVASVNAVSGEVTANSAGVVNITYTVNSGCGNPVAASKILTVNNAVTAGTVNGTSPLCVGATANYTSTGTSGGSWSSTNTSVATVNSGSGVVTAVGAGTADITYTITGCNGTFAAFKTVTVNANVIAGTISGTSPLCSGATATYTSNGTAGGSWSSSNTGVATVNAVSGVVTAVSAGTVNITYTVGSGCGSPVSSFKTLTVSPNVTAGTVNGTSPMCIGTSTTYTKTGTAGGTWSSTNTAVASVNAGSGVVTALSAGTTNITYTVSGCSGTVSSFKTLTVNPNVTAGTVNGTSPLCAGSTTTYTKTGTAGGTWSSSNTSVATVNASSGLVTAVALGTANIIYTVGTGCGSPATAFKTLTVSGTTPVVTCPVSGNANRNATSICRYTVSGTEFNATASASCGTPSLSYNLTGVTTGSGTSLAGVQFNRGVTTVTWTATNGPASSSCSFTVTVVDISAPTITCPANIGRTLSGNNKCNTSVTVPNPSTSDNCGVTVVNWVMTGANNASSALTGINYVGTQSFNVGITTITYTVKDAAGNTSTCQFTVTVTNSKCPNSPAAPKNGKFANRPSDQMTVSVLPNPSTYDFTMVVNSVRNERVDIRMIDLMGRIIELRSDIKPNSTVRFGSKYLPGIYIVEVLQGDEKVVKKLIKIYR